MYDAISHACVCVQEHMTEGASNGGNHSSCKFEKHDLVWKTTKWVLIELRASLIVITSAAQLRWRLLEMIHIQLPCCKKV